MISKGKIATRLILIISLSASLTFTVILAMTQWQARKIIERKVITNATNITKAVSRQIETVLQDTSWVVEKMAKQLETEAMDAKALNQLLQDALSNNPQIYGSTTAFAPEMPRNPPASGRSGLYAPYAYRKGDAIAFRQLEDSYDYRTWDWYRIPYAQGQALWSEPYFDEGGGDSLMTTYSVPFYRGLGNERRIAGIVTGDISLGWLANLFDGFKVLDSGYIFLLSRTGQVMFHPNSSLVMRETVASIAQKTGDRRFQKIGERMMRGENAFIPYQNPEGLKARLYYGPIPTTGWSLGIVFPETELFADTDRLSMGVAILGVLGILLMTLIIMVTSRTITQPLRDLANAAGLISSGDFSFKLPAAEARDEVGDLSRALSQMQADLRAHIEKLLATTSAKERIENELAIAHNIQLSLVPKVPEPFPGKGRIDLYALMEPAKEVGGDFYDYFWLDASRICLVMADVSGKGVPAALFMAMSKTLLKTIAATESSPAAMLGILNNQLAAENDQSMFVTLFCAVLDIESGQLTYANAGHNPPVSLPRHGAPAFLTSKHQLVIGAMEDYVYQNESIRLQPGDQLLLYTDGVTEAMNAEDALYGEEHLLRILAQLKEAPVTEMLNGCLASIKAFAGTTPQSDDITLMVIRRMGAVHEIQPCL